MTIKKDDAMQKIQQNFEKLANLILQQLDHMEHLISSGELKVSDELHCLLLQNEDTIDSSEVRLSDNIINTIVLQHPVASDLRWLIACYRILINLERIGDRVINIAEFIKRIKTPEIYTSFNEVLSTSAILSTKMVRKALLSFTENDSELAIWAIKNDSIMDEINSKLMKKLAKKAEKETEERQKNLVISIISINEMMSNLERIGDYATNIAEAAIYSIEGEDIRHHKIN